MASPGRWRARARAVELLTPRARLRLPRNLLLVLLQAPLRGLQAQHRANF